MDAPTNRLLKAKGKLGNGLALRDYTRPAGTLAKGDATLIHALNDGKWPAAARGPVTAFIATLLVERGAWRDRAASQNFSEENAAVAAFNSGFPKSNAAAGRVRLALDLPLN